MFLAHLFRSWLVRWDAIASLRLAGVVCLVCLCPSIVRAAWHQVETPNFRVWAAQPELANRVAAACEQQRSELQMFWSSAERAATNEKNLLSIPECWPTRCEVVVHPTQTQYAAAVGPGGGQSFGASYWRLERGQIAQRRIDLRSDQRDPCIAALPHELTHLVLADHFPARPLPRWLDEGIAILADPLSKQHGHENDWLVAKQQATSFRLVELLEQQQYPPAERVQAFYGQSAAMVRDLLSRKSPAELLRFIETAQHRGYDLALREHYGLENLSRWEEELLRSKSLPSVSPELVQYLPISATRSTAQ